MLVGGIASAATTGALVAMGRRLGSVGVPFAAIGATVLHRTISSAEAGLVLAGLLLHLIATFVWSAVFLRMVGDRPARVTWVGIAVAAAAFTVSWLVAWWTGAGVATVLPLGDRIVLAVVFAGTLVLGMRFAFLSSQSA